MSRLIVSFACCAAACLTWALAAGAAPGEPQGKFKGKTGQGRQIVVRAGHGQIDLLHFTISLTCRDGSVLIDQESGFEPTEVGGGGKFHDDQVGSTDEVWFRGQVSPRRIHGRVRVKDRVGKVRCDSHWVGFDAKPAGR